MLRTLPLWALLVALAACGDDAKVGSRGAPPSTPSGPPAGTPASPTPAPAPTPAGPATPTAPAPAPTGQTPPAAGVPVVPRVGDWATWTVRVAGSDGMTRLTWRIVSLDAIQAGVSITSATTDGSGRDLSASETQTKIDLAKLRPTSRLQGATPSEPVVVGARRIPVRVAFVGETKAWV